MQESEPLQKISITGLGTREISLNKVVIIICNYNFARYEKKLLFRILK